MAVAMAAQSLVSLPYFCQGSPPVASSRLQVCSLSSPLVTWDYSCSPSLAGVGRQFRGHPSPLLRLQRHCIVRAVADSDQAPGGISKGLDLPPPGCSRIKLELSKPLGIVLEEDKAGNIFVAGLVGDGNAAKSGLVDVGDQLIATSAVVYSDAESYQGVQVRKGMQIVRLNVRGERFETVMAAIGTHPAYIKVALELQKCKPVNGSVNGSANS